MAYALALGLKSHQIEDVVNKFRTQLLLRIPELAFKLPWNTFTNYGLISNDIVRDIALLTLKASHIDKEDITFKELERDLIITGTNLSDSYFSHVPSRQHQTCPLLMQLLIHAVGKSL